MIKVWFQEQEEKMHGGMQFPAECIAWVHKPTRNHPRRMVAYVRKSTRAEVDRFLAKRHPFHHGIEEVDQFCQPIGATQ